LNNKKTVRITLNEAQITEAELKLKRIALKGREFVQLRIEEQIKY